jgi:hypothetical protein
MSGAKIRADFSSDSSDGHRIEVELDDELHWTED